jgi:DNA-binding response OmpR family regulator
LEVASVEKRVLVVEDERTIADAVAARLRAEGFTVEIAGDGPAAVLAARRTPPDLIVLDVMLPGFDGLEVCRRIQAERPVPILMLTARDDEIDKVLGLEIGADDYITKPFSIRELRSRIRAAMRRATLTPAAEPAELIEADGLAIDLPRRTVEIRGEPVQLTYLEFELLRTLAAAPGHVFTRQALLDKLWGGSAFRDPRTIDVHVRHLREKIERSPSEPEFIFTVRGVGYRFRDG